MLKFECPHCHQRTISFWRWEYFHQLPNCPDSIVCTQCRGNVGVPFWPVVWWTLPVVACFAAGIMFLGLGFLIWTLVAAVAVAASFLQPQFMSLIKK
jgi:hypothetical protein